MGPRVLLLALAAVLASCRGSMVDVDVPMVFRGDAGGAFGLSVAQFGNGGVLVGAPLQRVGVNETGAVYHCQHHSQECREVPVTAPEAVNASLGLALVAGDTEAMVCGPTAPQACGENLHLNGFCLLLDANVRQLRRIPAAPPECPRRLSDVALLIDGSGSVSRRDFETMKTFIAEVMRRFQGTDTQFALSQYSHTVQNHFNFTDFRRTPDPSVLLRGVAQLGRTTHTATAIKTVLETVFTPATGAREGARRILIVITDGEKYGDELQYSHVIPLANAMGVTRYAIGVGVAFNSRKTEEELRTIASAPSSEHVFRVDNFDALQGIRDQLEEKIFAIEGTQSAHSSSFQLEMAQEGFSALLTPEGPVLGAVGAYDWSGGVFIHGSVWEATTTFVNVSHGAADMKDAYLGYAAESLSLRGRWALALGAPRYRHVGRLLLFLHQPRGSWDLLGSAVGTQVGSYFGASLCALDTDGNRVAKVLLVGAPMFYGGGSGGRVHICTLRVKHGTLACQQTLQGQPGHPLGRFGASLGRLGDLNGDGRPEVAVGAPLEDEGHGAIYIFHGMQGGVASQYSQRISGARFPSGPRFFGQAISGGRDLTGDRLPDVAVGAWGQVLLLRSPPLLQVQVTVTFRPPEIPVAAFDCHGEEAPAGEVAEAKFCFLSTKKTKDNFDRGLSTTLRYQAALDPGRATGRAVFTSTGAAVRNGTLRLGVGQLCETLALAFRVCPWDTLTPLELRVTYEATGDPIEGAGGLRPALSQDSTATATGSLPFEKNCGADNVCEDKLLLSAGFSGLETVVVGVTDVVDVTVTLHNAGEDSYATTVQLQHDEALSYRKATVVQSSRRSVFLNCKSAPGEGQRRGTLCLVNHPIFRAGAKIVFNVTLDVPHDVELGDSLVVTASATSEKTQDGPSQRMEVPVKYGVFLVLTSAQNSTKYVNASAGAGVPASAPVTHHYELKTLGRWGVPVNVTFWVPWALGGTVLWDKLGVTPNQELVQCQEVAEHQGVPNAPPQLRGRPMVDCAVAVCRELRCWVPAQEPPQVVGFSVGGNLTLGWLPQTQQPKVVVASRAGVRYDEGRYQNRGGELLLQVQTELELLETPNPLPLILGGSVGGLLLLGLLVLGLYKVGFFKRRYKELMEGDGTTQEPLGDPQG